MAVVLSFGAAACATEVPVAEVAAASNENAATVTSAASTSSLSTESPTPAPEATAITPDVALSPAPTDEASSSTDPTSTASANAARKAAEAPTPQSQEFPPTPPAWATCDSSTGTAQASVSGVNEWVRTRAGSSRNYDVVGQIDLGTTVTYFPDSLVYDGSEYWWVTVVDPQTNDCVSVAAAFLADPFGRLDRPYQGLAFSLPSTGIWNYRPGNADVHTWTLDGAVYTAVSVKVVDENQIDAQLADQLDAFEEWNYDYPEDWYQEVAITGADRAVRFVPIYSDSGDVADERLLIEVGPVTIVLGTSIYIEDVRSAPVDEIQNFLDSTQINRPQFLNSVAPWAE